MHPHLGVPTGIVKAGMHPCLGVPTGIVKAGMHPRLGVPTGIVKAGLAAASSEGQQAEPAAPVSLCQESTPKRITGQDFGGIGGMGRQPGPRTGRQGEGLN
eukprot:358811-Chlamydomonas_euryale.AAC.21